MNQFAIISGMLVIYFVNYYIAQSGDKAWNMTVGWRWMFASGIVPSVVFFPVASEVPESPRWLIEQGRLDQARNVLSRIGGLQFAETELQAIRDAVAGETQKEVRLVRPDPAIRPVSRRGVGDLAASDRHQCVSVLRAGNFQAAWRRHRRGDVETIIVGSVNLGVTFLAMGTVDRLGRKRLMIVGAVRHGCLPFRDGRGVAISMGRRLGIGSAFGLYRLFCDVGRTRHLGDSVGNLSQQRARARAMSLATFALWIANFIVSQTFPMMDESPGLIARFHHGFPFYVYGLFFAYWSPWFGCACRRPRVGRSKKSRRSGRGKRKDDAGVFVCPGQARMPAPPSQQLVTLGLANHQFVCHPAETTRSAGQCGATWACRLPQSRDG